MSDSEELPNLLKEVIHQAMVSAYEDCCINKDIPPTKDATISFVDEIMSHFEEVQPKTVITTETEYFTIESVEINDTTLFCVSLLVGYSITRFIDGYFGVDYPSNLGKMVGHLGFSIIFAASIVSLRYLSNLIDKLINKYDTRIDE